jgi:hypothetical protein
MLRGTTHTPLTYLAIQAYSAIQADHVIMRMGR